MRNRFRPNLRRALWTAAYMLATVLLVAVVAAALLLLQPVRNRVLSFALDKTRAALPGRLDVGQARWSALGRIELENAVWTDGQDTLAVVDRVAISVAMRPLASRRMVVRELTALGFRADVPAIARRFAPTDGAAAPTEPRNGRGFLRTGSVPGVPAVAVEKLVVSAPHVRVTEDVAIEAVEVAAAFNLLDGRPPSVNIDRLHLVESDGRFRVDQTRQHVDIDAGAMSGAGNGRFAPGLVAAFELHSATADAFDLHVTLTDSLRSTLDGVALDVSARFARRGLEVRSMDFVGTVRVPPIDSLPSLLRGSGDQPAPAGVLDVGFDGRYERRVDDSSGLRLRADARPPFGGLDARLTFQGGGVAVDTLAARWQDVDLSGRGRLSADGSAEAALAARGVVGGLELDDFRCRFSARSLRSPPYEIDLSAVAAGMRLAARAQVERRGGWLLRMQPLVLTERAATVRVPSGARGVVRVGTTGAVRVERLVLVGDAGRYVLTGSLSPERRGNLRIDCDWSEPPTSLLSRAVPDDDRRAALSAGWPDTVRGTLTATADLSSGARDVRGVLTLASPGWVDSGLVRLRVSGNDVEVDTLGATATGLRLQARGALQGGLLNATARLKVERGSLVDRLVPGLVGFSGEADASFAGSLDVPRVRASMRAVYDGPRARAPSIVGRGSWSRERLSLQVACPQGLVSGPLVLDSLALALDSHGAKLLPAQVVVGAHGSDLTFLQRLRVTRDHGWAIDTDSLVVVLKGQRLSSPRAFRVRIEPDRGRVTLGNVEMSGTLGTLNATGFAQPDSSELKVNVDIALPPKPASLTLPDPLWPGRLAFSLAAAGGNDVEGSLLVSGFALGDHDDLEARLTAKAEVDSIRGTLTLAGRAGALASGTFRLPGTVDVFPPRVGFGDGAVSARVELRDFPLPGRRNGVSSGQAPEWIAQVRGEVWVEGTGAAPSAGADLSVSFPGRSPLSSYVVDIDAYLSARTLPKDVPLTGPDAAIARFVSRLDSTQGVGFVATAQMAQRGRNVADGAVRLPIAWSLAPPVLVLDSDQPMFLSCTSHGLMLSELAPLLPADVGLEGRLQVEAVAQGLLADPSLAGELKGSDLKFTHANGTRVEGLGELRLGGTGKSPAIAGQLQIANGVITIPDAPSSLHPTEGESVLLNSVAGDSAHGSGASAGEDVPAQDAPPATPRLILDVTLVIPSALWIRGKGLDVELAGNLKLTKDGSPPAVTGELKAVRGQLLFLGRTFTVARGTAVFYGEDNVNPSLDLELTTNVEGTQVIVQMRGTAEAPEISLTSEPPMEEGDIMSFLVFGKPMDELNSDQVGLVQRRAAETAATFGAQLAARLSRQMGVDLVTLSRGQSTGQSTLTVGKYVTRRALLKYEQSLEERATFLIDLEYFLTRHLRLETFLGQQQQSGVEVNWTRDY